MNERSVVREKTVCPVVVRIAAILLLLPVVLPTVGAIIGLATGHPLAPGQLPPEHILLGVGLLGAAAIISAVYMLLGRPWGYYVTLLLSLPTVLVPALLLLGFREYMAYTAHVEMQRERRAALLC